MFGGTKQQFVSLDSVALQSVEVTGGVLVRDQGREERKMELRASRLTALSCSQLHVARPQGNDSMEYEGS